MSTPIDPTLLKELIAATKEIQAAVLKSNQIGKARKPYYTEKYAREVGKLLELISGSGEPQMIPEGDFTSNTIRLQWYQGKEYLLKHLDPDGKFAELDKIIEVTYLKKRGLVLAPRRQKGILAAFKIQPWRQHFEIYLEESGPMEKFERIGVGLTEDDFHYVSNLLEPLADTFVWHCDLKHDHLKVIHISNELRQTPN